MNIKLGDLLLDTCFVNKKDWKTGLIVTILDNDQIKILWSHEKIERTQDLKSVLYNIKNKVYIHYPVKQ